MGATQAKTGFGGLFKIHDDNSPGAYVTVGECKELSAPGISRDAPEATHSESPDGYREFIPGLLDGGEASVTINFVPGSAGMTIVMAQLASAQLSACKITVPTTPAYAWTFDAVLTGLTPPIPIDDVMTVELTFKVSGKPALAADS